MYYNCHFKDVCIADQCRNLEFGPEKAFDGKRLIKPHNSHRGNYSFRVLRKLVLYGARLCQH